jgi:glycosyltransferase involved in cell wall biosynthesis
MPGCHRPWLTSSTTATGSCTDDPLYAPALLFEAHRSANATAAASVVRMVDREVRRRFVVVSADERAIVAALHSEAEWPRQDVVELASALDAELLSYSDLRNASWFTRVLARVAKPLALAWLAFRKRGTFYFATAENTALPLALLLKLRSGAALAFIGHLLTTPLKTWLIRGFRLLRNVDVVFCYSPVQEQHITRSLGVPAQRVRRMPFQVDERFFSPSAAPVVGRGVVSVGREMRDYPTLFAAFDGTGIPVTVVASSPWSNSTDSTANHTIPENVTICRNVSQRDLREIYRTAAVVVLPLVDVDFPAGITALLEAQACGRPVVVTASRGIVDAVDADSAVMVPCHDAAALRAAVIALMERPDEALRLGQHARARVLHERTLARWLSRIVERCTPSGAEARAGG